MVKPHARTKYGSRHAALRAVELFYSYGYVDFNKLDALVLRCSPERGTRATCLGGTRFDSMSPPSADAHGHIADVPAGPVADGRVDALALRCSPKRTTWATCER